MPQTCVALLDSQILVKKVSKLYLAKHFDYRLEKKLWSTKTKFKTEMLQN